MPVTARISKYLVWEWNASFCTWKIVDLIIERGTKEESVKGGRTGLTDRRDVSNKEESSDRGYFARDSLKVSALREGDRHKYVTETGWQRERVRERGKGCIGSLTGGMCWGKSRVQIRDPLLRTVWRSLQKEKKKGSTQGKGREKLLSCPAFLHLFYPPSLWIQTVPLLLYSTILTLTEIFNISEYTLL